MPMRCSSDCREAEIEHCEVETRRTCFMGGSEVVIDAGCFAP